MHHDYSSPVKTHLKATKKSQEWPREVLKQNNFKGKNYLFSLHIHISVRYTYYKDFLFLMSPLKKR